MERLVTSAQAAEILGLSLQGIHYRIRNNKLKSIKQSGKTYVYISDNYEKKIEQPLKEKVGEQSSPTESIVSLKNEQIALLKKSIKWLKRQHRDEIHRIEKNQNQIVEVFNSEIKLLQSAFNEMRSIYKPQIESKQIRPHNDATEFESEVSYKTKRDKFISLHDFTLYMKKHHKDSKEIKMIIITALQNRDGRFMYNKKTKKILILNRDYSDLL